MTGILSSLYLKKSGFTAFTIMIMTAIEKGLKRDSETEEVDEVLAELEKKTDES